MQVKHLPFLRDSLRLNLVETEGAEPIIFQHGLCGSALQTLEVFPNDPRFALRTLECRGHGASEVSPEKLFSINQFCDDIAAVVEAGSKRPLIIGGISMGAAISLRLAVRRPDLVKALVLARPAWLTDAAPANIRPNAEVGELLASVSAEEARRRFLESTTAEMLRQHSPDNLSSLLGFFEREPIAVTSALLRSIAADGPGVTRDQVSQIKVPALIIATEQDVIHPMSHAEGLHNLISGSRLTRLTPKGVDRKAYVSEFKTALLRFFEEHA